MGSQEVDFFVSYTSPDREWAEWIAWTLEEGGYQTRIQAWDFRPGHHFVSEMDQASQDAVRTLVVLSSRYLRSGFAKAEWAAAFVQDPTGTRLNLLPVRIEDCNVEGMLGQIVYVDLVGLDRKQAREQLLGAARGRRAKPKQEPPFPSHRAQEPLYPGLPLSADDLVLRSNTETKKALRKTGLANRRLLIAFAILVVVTILFIYSNLFFKEHDPCLLPMDERPLDCPLD